jgi:UrcA family protein
MFAVALGLAASAAGGAFAQSEYQASRSDFERVTTAVPVTYGDLDLSSHDGAAVMLGRLQHAAINACGASDFSVKDYRFAVKRSACFRQSMDRAVADLGAPAVTRLYGERGTYASN